MNLLSRTIHDYWQTRTPSRCSQCLTRLNRPRSSDTKSQVVCNACQNLRYKGGIDWEKRAQDFANLIHQFSNTSTLYDVLIPVSGGKDSYWQVSKALEFGFNPLCITYSPSIPTEYGTYNLNNLSSLGVDHFIVRPDDIVNRKLSLKGFETFGFQLKSF